MHGSRTDDFYWLRDDARTNPEVVGYLQAENDYASAMLRHCRSLEDGLYQEIIARIPQEDCSVPTWWRGDWYYRRYETGREYPLYARRRGSQQAPEEQLLDANQLAAGADYYEVGGLAVSPSGSLLAWTEDRVGRRQFTLRLRDLDSGQDLPGQVANVEAGVVWTADSRSVLYLEKDPQSLLPCRLRQHVLGSDFGQDELVYELEDESLYLSVEKTRDQRYLLLTGAGHDSTEVHYADAAEARPRFHRMLAKEDGHEYYPEHLDGEWFIRSNWHAPNFRLVRVPVGQEHDRAAWHDVLAHRDDVLLEDFSIFRRYLAVNERAAGLLRVRVMTPAGGDLYLDADEPAFAAELDTGFDIDSPLLRYTSISLTTPLTTWEYDVDSGQRRMLKREVVKGDFDPARYRIELRWATAQDGERIPVSIVYRADLAIDGRSPLLQYGYGAYGLSMDPSFSAARLSLLDRGFVFAIAHVRGGQELGRRWYEAGKLLHKQNTFNDFIDVTRFLVEAGYADCGQVFAMGGSAGGLLMGAVANQAPGLYRGIVAQVPFVDVLTTMLDESLPLTTLEYVEWGDPRQLQYYEYIRGYSPYDNVVAQDYPAMLVTTGLWDSQVQYFEPAKWVAKLRRLKTDDHPLLLRTQMEAGHGGKSGRFRRYREIAEAYAFILDLAGIGDAGKKDCKR